MLTKLIYWLRRSYRAPFAICPDCHRVERAFWIVLSGHENCLPF